MPLNTSISASLMCITLSPPTNSAERTAPRVRMTGRLSVTSAFPLDITARTEPGKVIAAIANQINHRIVDLILAVTCHQNAVEPLAARFNSQAVGTAFAEGAGRDRGDNRLGSYRASAVYVQRGTEVMGRQFAVFDWKCHPSR